MLKKTNMSPLERRDNRVHVDKGVLMRAFRILQNTLSLQTEINKHAREK